MKRYSLSHVADEVLIRDLAAAIAHERTSTALVLAHVAEFDTRKLYLPAGYPSMFAYCVGELHLSEDAAYKRIKAARAARRFPVILDAVADGRLHLSAVVVLAPHLTECTAPELLAAAMHRTKSEIEQLVAERFPQPDVPTWVEPIQPVLLALVAAQQAPGPVEGLAGAPADLASECSEQAPGPVQSQLATAPAADRSKVKPLAPQRYAVQFTMSQTAHDKLRHAQELLGHRIAAGDIAGVFERALDALIPELEKVKFAATEKPLRCHARTSENSRHIPAHVKRAVWERDGAQCTFVGESGRRCRERKGLQFDHILEFARGGEATVAGMRLRCQAHNQYGAECTFGPEFMRHKRIAAGVARAAEKARAATGARTTSP